MDTLFIITCISAWPSQMPYRVISAHMQEHLWKHLMFQEEFAALLTDYVRLSLETLCHYFRIV